MKDDYYICMFIPISEANRIKEKLRAEHGLDVNKLMKMYETYGKLFG